MVLDREARRIEQLNALGGAVIEIHMRQANAAETLVHHDRRDTAAYPDAQIAIDRVLGLTARKLGDELAQAWKQQSEAVVLRSNLHAAADQIHNRLVAATVTEFEFFHLAPHAKLIIW